MDTPYERRLDMILLRNTVAGYSRFFQRLHIHNACPLPATGPAIIASNHTAGLDPVLVQAASPRPVNWIMTREFYDIRFLRWFFKWSEMIPIDRLGRDAAAWREALRKLERGRVIGVFPEGRIETTPELMKFQTGPVQLAVRAKADVYPVYIDGWQRRRGVARSYLLPQRPSLAWGEPVRCSGLERDDKETVRRLTEELRDQVESLRQRYPAPSRAGHAEPAAPDPGEAEKTAGGAGE